MRKDINRTQSRNIWSNLKVAQKKSFSEHQISVFETYLKSLSNNLSPKLRGCLKKSILSHDEWSEQVLTQQETFFFHENTFFTMHFHRWNFPFITFHYHQSSSPPDETELYFCSFFYTFKLNLMIISTLREMNSSFQKKNAENMNKMLQFRLVKNNFQVFFVYFPKTPFFQLRSFILVIVGRLKTPKNVCAVKLCLNFSNFNNCSIWTSNPIWMLKWNDKNVINDCHGL